MRLLFYPEGQNSSSELEQKNYVVQAKHGIARHNVMDQMRKGGSPRRLAAVPITNDVAPRRTECASGTPGRHPELSESN